MRSESQERFLGMEVHPAASVFPLMKGQEFTDLKEDILRTKGNGTPITRQGNVLLDGRNRARAIEELNGEGHAVEPLYEEWQPVGGETPAEFIKRKNLHRRHLTVEQRVAAMIDLLPEIKKEREEMQRASQIKPGEVRNPYGCKGKPETAAVNSPPPSREDLRQRRREKDERSAIGRIAKEAGTSIDKVKKVKKAIELGGPEAKEKIRAGESKAKDFLPKKTNKSNDRPGADDPAFRDSVERDYRKLLGSYAVADHRAVRSELNEIVRRDQQECGERKPKADSPAKRLVPVSAETDDPSISERVTASAGGAV